MKEKRSCFGTENVAHMNSPALICQPVSASDNRNPIFDNERERNRARKIKFAKEGINIFDWYFRKSDNDTYSFKSHQESSNYPIRYFTPKNNDRVPRLAAHKPLPNRSIFQLHGSPTILPLENTSSESDYSSLRALRPVYSKDPRPGFPTFSRSVDIVEHPFLHCFDRQLWFPLGRHKNGEDTNILLIELTEEM